LDPGQLDEHSVPDCGDSSAGTAGSVAYTTAKEVDRLVAGVREIARC